MRLLLLVTLASVLTACQANTTCDSETATTKAVSEDQPVVNSTPVQEKTIADLNVQEFLKKYHQTEGAILIDVRTQEEADQGMIDGAIVMDFYSDDFETQVKQLDTSKPYFLYCRSGGRSGEALRIFESLGFQEAYNMLGGYRAYSKMKDQ